jgi:tetratricopeptide (TPR) repeat protein
MYQARKFAVRHKTLVCAAVAVFQAVRANRERDRALRAEQVARAVNGFLQNDLLAQAGARAQAGRNTQPDPDLKVRTALDRAAERIAGKFDSQPAVEASIRRTIGLAYFDLNLYPQAQQQLERTVDLRKRVLGPEDPDTLTSMDELGVLYNLEGKYTPAEALLTKVSEARQRVLGSNHKDTLTALADLALTISYQGDDARAEPLG